MTVLALSCLYAGRTKLSLGLIKLFSSVIQVLVTKAAYTRIQWPFNLIFAHYCEKGIKMDLYVFRCQCGHLYGHSAGRQWLAASLCLHRN